jgi:arylsulfatase A-like enzyme
LSDQVDRSVLPIRRPPFAGVAAKTLGGLGQVWGLIGRVQPPAMLQRDAAPFAKVLKENGYSTAGIGTWHLTPEGEQGLAGPFTRWPNAGGFDYYWGFLAPEAGQYDTMTAESQKFIGVQEGKDGKAFYFPEAMTDQAIDWVHGVRGQLESLASPANLVWPDTGNAMDSATGRT